jgi:hypothetical protein
MSHGCPPRVYVCLLACMCVGQFVHARLCPGTGGQRGDRSCAWRTCPTCKKFARRTSTASSPSRPSIRSRVSCCAPIKCVRGEGLRSTDAAGLCSLCVMCVGRTASRCELCFVFLLALLYLLSCSQAACRWAACRWAASFALLP